VLVGGGQLALVEVDAGDLQIREATQQDLGLRPYATAYFKDVAGTAEVNVLLLKMDDSSRRAWVTRRCCSVLEKPCR